MRNLFSREFMLLAIITMLTACNTDITQHERLQTSDNKHVGITQTSSVDTSKSVPVNLVEAEKLIETVKNANSNLVYINLAQDILPPDELEITKKRFENLQKLNSFSGGKITHEFTHADAYKSTLLKHGSLANIMKKLNFEPTDINAVLGNDFKLVGADYSGTFNNGKYNSIYRYYENTGDKRFEINEMYIPEKGDSTLTTYKEAINFNLNGYPATLQKIKTNRNKQIYDLDFNVKNRSFSISSEGFSYDEFLRTCIYITNLAQKNS